MGQRLIIIELGKYKKVGKLLIGINTTGSLRHICYWDMGLEGIENYVSCPHGEEGDRGMNMTGVHTVSCQVGNGSRHECNGYGAIKEASLCNMKYDRMKQGL